METTVRTRWIVLSDADKCRYNGYMDFVTKETAKMRQETLEKARN